MILSLEKSTIEDAFSDKVFKCTSVKLKNLTNKQNCVIYCLQNGCCLITSSEVKGTWIGGKKGQFHINGSIFWNLYNKGLIYQRSEKHGYDYGLTLLGEKLITKHFDLSNIN